MFVVHGGVMSGAVLFSDAAEFASAWSGLNVEKAMGTPVEFLSRVQLLETYGDQVEAVIGRHREMLREWSVETELLG